VLFGPLQTFLRLLCHAALPIGNARLRTNLEHEV
jgi:hypothetical protein